MKVLTETDGDVFLPNPAAGGAGGVRLYLHGTVSRQVGSLRRRGEVEGRSRIPKLPLFDRGLHPPLLHSAVSLCAPTQQYHITDLSKGAMLVARASVTRTQRYDRWYGLLMEELDLVATSGAGIFAVGNAIAHHLERRAFPRPFTKVIHYSGLAARARTAGIVGHEDRFEEFKSSVSLKRVLATAEDVLRASAVPASFRDETLARLAKSQLSESRQQLIFNYKRAFEAMGSSGWTWLP